MAEQHGDPTPDPYDPARRAGRRLAGPRIPDLTQPMELVEDRPAVARPYAPAPRQKPESVVPPQDNPLVGWRWFGVMLLSRDLWPRDAATNPMMAYYSGRIRGRQLEDLAGILPWLIFLTIEVTLYLTLVTTPQHFWTLGIVGFFLAPTFAALLGASFVAIHVRRILHSLPVDELLLTRLRPDDIAQGLSVRPIAVQSTYTLGAWLVHMIVAALTALDLGAGKFPAWAAFYLLGAAPLRWYFCSVALETGAAIGLRAHMCIRQTNQAIMRMLIDLTLIPITMGVTAGLVVVLIAFGAYVVGALLSTILGILGLFMLMGFVTILWAVGSLGAVAVRGVGSDAMDWCHHYPNEWWFKHDDEELTGERLPRTAFTPWKQLANRPRGYFAGFGDARRERARRREAREREARW